MTVYAITTGAYEYNDEVLIPSEHGYIVDGDLLTDRQVAEKELADTRRSTVRSVLADRFGDLDVWASTFEQWGAGAESFHNLKALTYPARGNKDLQIDEWMRRDIYQFLMGPWNVEAITDEIADAIYEEFPFEDYNIREFDLMEGVPA